MVHFIREIKDILTKTFEYPLYTILPHDVAQLYQQRVTCIKGLIWPPLEPKTLKLFFTNVF